MPPQRRAPRPEPLVKFLTDLQAALEVHPLVRTAWLEGSLGRGNADRYSDVNLHVWVDEADLPDFRSGLEAWLGQLRPLVLFNLLFGGHMVNALTAEGIRLDIWPRAGGAPSLDLEKVQVLVDRSRAVRLNQVPRPPDPAALGQQALAQIREFWRCITLLPAVIGRDERLVGFSGLAVELNLVAELLMLGTGTVRDRGVKRLNTYLPIEARERLERIVTLPDLSPSALVEAHLGLARLVQEVGPWVAQQYGVPYPEALEEAALRYVQHELRGLGHDLDGFLNPS
jgi:hypothetical protein